MSKRHHAGHKHPSRASRRRRKRAPEVARSRVNVISEAGGIAVTSNETPIVPDAIRRRFIAVRGIYSLPGGGRAFVDRGDRLTTRRENADVIQSLAAIARARGWAQVSVAGTDRFKRRMWLAARLAGLTVHGPAPDSRTQAELTRALSRRARRASQLPLSLSRTAPTEDTHVSPTPSLPRRPTPGPREWRGRLIDHGEAPYRHDPANDTSYFVKLRTPTGERDVWGVDLKRALRASLSVPVPGDEVVLRREGTEAVTSREGAREGETHEERAFHRNRFWVERADFLEARADRARVVRDTSVSASEATRRYPELSGTYLQLRAAQLAAPRLRHAQDQRQFVGLIRRALVTSIARGEPFRHLRMRAHASTRDARSERPARAAEPLRD